MMSLPAFRDVSHTLEGMSVLMSARPRDALVFTAPQGGPVTDGTSATGSGTRSWRQRA